MPIVAAIALLNELEKSIVASINDITKDLVRVLLPAPPEVLDEQGDALMDLGRLLALSTHSPVVDGFRPKDLGQRFSLEISLTIPAIGRERRRRSCCRGDDLQFGNPTETGRPSMRIDRRSGGKEKLQEVSMAVSSKSERPAVTGTPMERR
ncbi:uncharacterized protein A4U43_C03F24020 [Asparagus officinalis]|uniref:Uncharacterized protein n=1 Tax=Asparagus officinalis TaxID=4686 RepID=A0A5P1FHJ3_ASPOF|nr:uncharacterized protein A4U43_C03F24020 [Asparagus officinalis]